MKGIYWITLVSAIFATGISYASRASVSSAEVNGTFLSKYNGKFKDFANKLTIKAQGGGKLRINFELVYPIALDNNEITANMGTLAGEASIKGDTAIYASTEYGSCKITMVFTKPGEIKVTQTGADFDCGFGHNVTADGVYLKTQ